MRCLTVLLIAQLLFMQMPAAGAANVALSAQGREAASLLGILPKVERLIQLKQQRQHSAPLTDEELALKVDVLDKVLGASLEVRMVAGRIDRELAWAYSGAGGLQAKRQRNLNMLFTANFMQGGILGVLSGPAFLAGHPNTGTKLLLIASSIGLGLSTLSFIEARRGSKPMDGGGTILGNVFDLKDTTEPQHEFDLVSKYIHSVPPLSAGNKTRVELLVDGWRKGHYLKSTSEASLQRLSAIQPEGKKYRENIGLLNDRIRMLFDTQYTVEMLHEGLLDLMRATELT